MHSLRNALPNLVPWIAATALVNGVSAQTKMFDVRTPTASGVGFGKAAAAVGDVDRDGISDFALGAPLDDSAGTDAGLIMVASGRTGREIWRTTGSGPNHQFGTLITGVGDVNLDGVPDILVTAPGAPTAAGLGAASVLSGVDGAQIWGIIDAMGTFGTHATSAPDLDGDGVADLIVGNTVTSRIWSGRTLALLVAAVPSPAVGVGDTNGNGINEYAYRDFLLGNDGFQTKELSGQIVLNWHGGTFPGTTPPLILPAGDVNNDGRADVVFADDIFPYWSSSNLRGGYAIVGIGGTYFQSGIIQANERRCKSLSTGGDFNADGIPDLVEAYERVITATPVDYRFRVLSGLNGSVLRDWDAQGLTNAVAGPADINSDGFAEVVLASSIPPIEAVEVWTGSDVVAVGRGCGGAVKPPILRGTPTNIGQNMFLAGSRSAGGLGGAIVSGLVGSSIMVGSCDLWVDLQSGFILGAPFAVRPALAEWAPHFEPALPPWPWLIAADTSGDGRADLAAVSASAWFVSRSNGHRFVPGTGPSTSLGAANGPFFAADVDGNGFRDAIGVNPQSGTWFVSWNSASGFSPTATLASSFYPNQQDYLVGDVNGDGRTDLIAWNSSANWSVATSNGTGVNPPSVWINHGFTCDTRLLGDVNGDGRADACAYWGDIGTWSVALSTGSSFAPPTNWHIGLGIGSRRQFFADVNGDGRADAVVEHSNGDWWISLSTGSSFAPHTQWASGFSNGINDIALCADVNGDGSCDAVVVDGVSGRVRVAPSLAATGSNTFAGASNDSWQFNHPIPYNTNLIGLQIAIQTILVPSARPEGYDISNALHERIR